MELRAAGLVDDIATTLAFYTRLPVGRLAFGTRSLAEAQWAAPIAGLVVGLAGWLAYFAATALDLPVTIAAAAALGATMLVTGCLHEDGLADVADGFGGGTTRERKLEIMRDSRIGTYGVAALALTILVRWSALAALASPWLAFFALLAAHAASRGIVPCFMVLTRPARPEGLSAGVGAIPSDVAIAALVLGGIALLKLGFVPALVAAFYLALWFAALKLICEQQIGGQTGDVLGTLQQGAEMIVLCAACAFFLDPGAFMSRFASMDDLRAACLSLPAGDEAAAAAALARQDTLTKPQGSLGRLEELAAWLARWQGRAMPRLDRVEVIVFAGSHGVTARGVSAFPAEVTGQMVANFAAGGAAINQLARQAGATLKVIPLDVDRPTADFTQAAAMDEAAFLAALSTGYEAVPAGTELLCLGEMGIGNTTAAAAIAAALFGGGGADWVGRGTGVDDAGLSRKAAVVDEALALHGALLGDPLAVAIAVGGRELAAIFGAVLAARHGNIPVLLDGFVCTAAAAPLAVLALDGLSHAQAAHVSAEAGHRRLLGRLALRPLLDLGMRLGEASGACLAVNVLRGALACHSGMASFGEAGVSEK